MSGPCRVPPHTEAPAAETGVGRLSPYPTTDATPGPCSGTGASVGWWTRRPAPPTARPGSVSSARTGSPGYPRPPVYGGGVGPTARAMGANAGPFPGLGAGGGAQAGGAARSAEPVLVLLPAWAGFVGPRATALGAHRARTVVARHHEARLITAVCAIPCLTGAEAREDRRGASRMKVAAGPARDPLVIVVRRGFPAPSIVLLPSTRSPARVCQRHPPPVDGARSR